MRLQRYLARSGFAPSRRKAEEMIEAGRVRVNGRPASHGDGAEPADLVELDGSPVALPETHVHLALNKPAGYLTTLQDEPGKHRRTVADLIPDTPGLVPVGRLDAATTGLLLFTNDGSLAHRITHPSREVRKEYLVTVAGNSTQSALDALAPGPNLDDGPMLPPKLSRVRHHHHSTSFHLTIREGRNRIIRRACEAVGLEVMSLHRVRVGPVSLGGLGPGRYRELTGEEVSRLP